MTPDPSFPPKTVFHANYFVAQRSFRKALDETASGRAFTTICCHLFQQWVIVTVKNHTMFYLER